MATIDPDVVLRALEAARFMSRMLPVRAAYLFGSQVEGRTHEWSDIDLALFLDGIEEWDMRRCVRAMYEIQMHAGLDVEAHLFPASAFEVPEAGSFAQHILKHGVRLDLTGIAA